VICKTLIDFKSRPIFQGISSKSREQLHEGHSKQTILYYFIGFFLFLAFSIINLLLLFLGLASDPVEKISFFIFSLIFLGCSVINAILIYREFKRKRCQH